VSQPVSQSVGRLVDYVFSWLIIWKFAGYFFSWSVGRSLYSHFVTMLVYT